MSESGTLPAFLRAAERVGSRSFAERRLFYDTFFIWLLRDKALQRAVKEQSKTNLTMLWDATVRTLEKDLPSPYLMLEPLQIHRKIVEGLPGEALFVSSAMAFDSVTDALRLFDVTSKTAKQRIGDRLSPSESEIALRIGRVFTMASKVFNSLDAAREYLQTPNFALGGTVPRDLLQTAEGEQLVLSELQTQAEGGPV